MITTFERFLLLLGVALITQPIVDVYPLSSAYGAKEITAGLAIGAWVLLPMFRELWDESTERVEEYDKAAFRAHLIAELPPPAAWDGCLVGPRSPEDLRGVSEER